MRPSPIPSWSLDISFAPELATTYGKENHHYENETYTFVYGQGQMKEHQFVHSNTPKVILKMMIPPIHSIMILSRICIVLLLPLFK